MSMDPMDREPNVYNRETNVYDTSGRSSNTLAYVIGGLVIALGLLAFLFYDGGRNEPSTTGSTNPPTESSSPPSPAAPGPATAPVTPAPPAAPAPAAPATPSSPQQ